MPAPVLLVAVLSLVCMAGINTAQVYQSVKSLEATPAQDRQFRIPLSKEGKNVVVIMLDRALGEYIPFLMEEKPELAAMFDGFTYYGNSVSFGGHTNFASPALLGGYDYTPVELNRREDQTMVEKHNEALKLMPTLFSQAGYRVTVANPPYANYQWVPDLSIFDDIPNCNAYIAQWKPGQREKYSGTQERNMRNFFCFSLMKTLPLPAQYLVYDGGQYLRAPGGGKAGQEEYGNQSLWSNFQASGYRRGFMMHYQVLEGLKDVTQIRDGGENTFLFLGNDTTHEPMMLQLPGYVPQEEVDNTAFRALLRNRRDEAGRVLKMNNVSQIVHYQSNMAALLRIGAWLDYLRAEGVYDNTRIILVSDHGSEQWQMDALATQGNGKLQDLERFVPLLMVKDFDAQGFTQSRDFMTNADVPSLALAGLVENPINPFTGNPVDMEEKTAHKQYIPLSFQWQLSSQLPNTFAPSQWAAVQDNIWDMDNWEFFPEETILQSHAAP